MTLSQSAFTQPIDHLWSVADYHRMVNLRKQQVSLYRQPESDHYRSVETYPSGELPPLAFPELRVPVSLLLAQEV